MRKWLGLIVGTALGANGLATMLAPADWYALVPGVSETGLASTIPHGILAGEERAMGEITALAWPLFGFRWYRSRLNREV